MPERRRVIWLVLMVMTFLITVVVSVACEDDVPPRPNSDSSEDYSPQGGRIPVDDNVYTISGEVVAEVETLSRPTSSRYSGTYFLPQFSGKGFVRMLVYTATPSTALAQPNRIVLIKTSDTKASALLTGDIVTFRCRAQYEAVAAVRMRETFDAAKADKVETWELDYCRLATPVISLERGQ